MALLAADGTSRLGSDAIGATVEKYRNSFRGTQASNNLWLMFRSLATRSSHMIGPKDTECGQAELSVEEDLLDVLALVQPADPCITAVQGDELRPHTSRILDSSEGYVYTLIPRKDLFSLLKLLLSIEIDKPKWGDRFYTGHAPSTSPDPDILNRVTDAVLRRFTQDEESDVNWQTFKDALSVSFVRFLCIARRTSLKAKLSPIFFPNSASYSQHSSLRRLPQKSKPPIRSHQPPSFRFLTCNTYPSFTRLQQLLLLYMAIQVTFLLSTNSPGQKRTTISRTRN